jgi:DNA-binding IclR family transcriptional regulator
MSNTTVHSIRNLNTISATRNDVVAEQARLASADKLLAVVELLMRSRDALSARAIADSVGINRSTTHRALNTLIHRGWVERRADAADYRLSVKFLALIHVAAQTRSFLEEIRPTLEALSLTSRETVHVGVLDETDVLHVDKIDSPERFGVSSKIGTRGPAHTASLGKALLAASSDHAVEEYIELARGLKSAERLRDPEKLRREIQLARERGYSIDNEEDAIGVRCLGVAIRGAGGIPLFAVSLTGPAPRFTMDRVNACVPVMLDLARDLSCELGWETHAPEISDFGTMQRIE